MGRRRYVRRSARSPGRALVASEGLPWFSRHPPGIRVGSWCESCSCVVTVGLALAACGGHDKAGGDAAAGARDDTDRDARRLAAHARAVRCRGQAARRGGNARDAARSATARRTGTPRAPRSPTSAAARSPFALIYARVFDDLGVDAFAPLLAPLAIDSLATEQRVIASRHRRPRAPGARQARRRRRCGGARDAPAPARAHAAAPAAGRLPRRVHRACAGRRWRSARSSRSARPSAGRSATTSPASTASRPTSASIEAARLDVGAASLTADVTLWPRLGVVVANPEAWKAAERAPAEGDAGGRARLPARGDRRAAARARTSPTTCSAAVGRRRSRARRPPTSNALRAALAPVTARLDRGRDEADRALCAPRPGPRPSTRRAARLTRAQPGQATPIDGVWEFDERRG